MTPVPDVPAALPVRALLWFVAVAFLLSWYPWILHRGFGVAGNGGPNPLGLCVAALVITACMRGRAGVTSLLASLVRLRCSPWLWLAALVIPVGSFALSVSLARLTGVTVAAPVVPAADMVERFVFIFLFIGVGEEPAWRGTMLPWLAQRMTPVKAALVVGCVWGVWHLPLMGSEFSWPIVPFFLLNVVAASVVLAWLYFASESVLMTMVVHASINVASAVMFHPSGAADASRLWLIHTLVWWTMAAAVLVCSKGRLGKRR